MRKTSRINVHNIFKIVLVFSFVLISLFFLYDAATKPTDYRSKASVGSRYAVKEWKFDTSAEGWESPDATITQASGRIVLAPKPQQKIIHLVRSESFTLPVGNKYITFKFGTGTEAISYRHSGVLGESDTNKGGFFQQFLDYIYSLIVTKKNIPQSEGGNSEVKDRAPSGGFGSFQKESQPSQATPLQAKPTAIDTSTHSTQQSGTSGGRTTQNSPSYAPVRVTVEYVSTPEGAWQQLVESFNDAVDNTLGEYEMRLSSIDTLAIAKLRITFENLKPEYRITIDEVKFSAEQYNQTNSPTPSALASQDTVPPTIDTMTGPEDGSTVEFANFCFPMHVSDNVSQWPHIWVRYSFDSPDYSGWTTEVAPCYQNISNGSHVFSVQAKDEAGNVSSVMTRRFTVNAPAPTSIPTSTPIPKGCTPVTFEEKKNGSETLITVGGAWWLSVKANPEWASYEHDTNNRTVTLHFTASSGTVYVYEADYGGAPLCDSYTWPKQ